MRIMLLAIAKYIVLFSALSEGEPVKSLEVLLQKPGDKAEASLKDERAVIAIVSPSGIGRAEIKPPDGKWPKTIVLNLALKDLEGFYAENDALRIQTSLKHEKPEVSVPGAGGQRKEVAAEDRHRIGMKRAGDRIEVELPTLLFGEGVKSIRVQWIDYYR